MKKEHIDYINYLEGIKTCIKNTHWASVNNSEHTRMDELADTVSDFEDEISEEFQGLDGQIKDNEVKPIEYTFSTVDSLLNDIKSKTMELYDSLENDKQYIGVRSEIESFIHSINKFKYLFKLALKEKKNDETKEDEENDNDVNEAIKNVVKISEKDLQDIINESVKLYLNYI